MIALLGREFVNLPLLCGVAGRSRDSSGRPARGAFSLRWFTVCQGAASICVCPFFFYSPLGQLPVLPQVHGCLVLPAALSCSLSIWVINAPGPSIWARACWDPSSLRAPRSECSDPVLFDGILQEPRHLLTVLLQSHQDAVKVYLGKKVLKLFKKQKIKEKKKRINYCCTCSQIIKM